MAAGHIAACPAHGANLASAIDWRAPWFAPHRADAEQVGRALAEGGGVAAALDRVGPRTSGSAIRFTASSALPPNCAYEAFIAQTASVPTRDNLHDLFNGLVWLAFPRTKRLLNQWQAAEIARAGVNATRGPLRDALTLLDENGAFLQAPDALWNALMARDWRRLFIDLRPLWQQARLVLFGHALLEKLNEPRKPITAHVLRLEASLDTVERADHAIAQTLAKATLARKPFVPLPVLGVPGWWAANDDPAFYDDALVFRPPRRRPTEAAGDLIRAATPPLAAFGPASFSHSSQPTFTEFS